MHNHLGIVFLLAIAAVPLGGCDRNTTTRTQQAKQRAQATIAPAAEPVPSFAALARRILPAVVAISTRSVASAGFHSFGSPLPPVLEGAGSGFFISADGLILTNHHVVENATRVEVRFSDNETVREAKVVGRDPETDIALLKIEAREPVPALTLGDSDAVQPGEWAIAVGNPLQFANTVTVGVISARGRALGLSETTAAFEDFIQTDAAINPGNSGGPLLNARGEVVGINTAMRAQAQNLGFATPINTAKAILEQLESGGRVRRGLLGVSVTDVDERVREAFDLSTGDGVLVQSVVPGGPAARAGLRRGDVILDANGHKVDSSRALIDAVSRLGPHKKIELVVLRNGGRTRVTATTAERPSAVSAEARPVQERGSDEIGIALRPVPAELRRAAGLFHAAGVQVVAVRPGSPAAEAGVIPADIIVEANGNAVNTFEDLRSAVSATPRGKYIRLYAARPGERPDEAQGFFALVKKP